MEQSDATVLMAVGYLQPVTGEGLIKIFGKEVGRHTIGHLRGTGSSALGRGARDLV